MSKEVILVKECEILAYENIKVLIIGKDEVKVEQCRREEVGKGIVSVREGTPSSCK